MSPVNIVKEALKKRLDIIGITDHNSTRQAKLVRELGQEQGLFVLCGAEVATKEDVHCLTFFPDDKALKEFQVYLDRHLPDIKNNTDTFGYQVCVNRKENIVFEEERLLISGINQSIDEVEEMVHGLNGIFIPAHINRKSYGIISQLGFVNFDLNYDALELSKHIKVEDFKKQNAYLKDEVFIQNSDAHLPDDIGVIFTNFEMKTRSFDEIKLALQNIEGRGVQNIVL